VIKVEAVVVRERGETVIDAVEESTGHVGVTVVEADDLADAVVEAIADAARTGDEWGDGLCWTSPVADVTHHRTDESL
jgi:nitrogen regulatory protein PII